MKCVFSFVCDVCCTSDNPLPADVSVWSMRNTMQRGRQHAWLSTVRGHQACPLQMMHGVQTHSAAYVAGELDVRWVVHRIVWNQLDYREVCAHWVPKDPTDDDKAHCIELYGPSLYPFDMLH